MLLDPCLPPVVVVFADDLQDVPDIEGYTSLNRVQVKIFMRRSVERSPVQFLPDWRPSSIELCTQYNNV